MAFIKDQAICVRVWDWSETSQTVSLLTREHGLVRAVAKGSKREKSPFSGGLEVLTIGEAVLSLKSAEALSLLMAWDLRETVPGARRSLAVFHNAMLAVDLVQHLVQAMDPHPRLFDGLGDLLRTLEARALAGRMVRYLWILLVETGHRPELVSDVRTGEVVGARETFDFLPRLGGVVAKVDASDQPVWRARAATVEYMREAAAAVEGRGAGGLDGGEVADSESARRAVRMLAAYVREVIQTEPASLKSAQAFWSGEVGEGNGRYQ